MPKKVSPRRGDDVSSRGGGEVSPGFSRGLVFLLLVSMVVSAALVWPLLDSSGREVAEESSLSMERRATARGVVALGAWRARVGGALEARLMTAGEGDGRVLKHSFKGLSESAPRQLGVRLEQHQVIVHGGEETVVQTKMSALALIELSSRDADRVFVSFANFSVVASTEKAQIETPAVDSLLRGLKIEVEIDGEGGLVRDLSPPGGNPQVKRLLSMLVDGLRQGHPVFTESAVGVGGEWEVARTWRAGETGSLQGRTQTTTRVVGLEGARGARLEGGITLTLTGEVAQEEDGGVVAVDGRGEGRVETTLSGSSGQVVRSVGTFSQAQTLKVKGGGESAQRMRLTFEVFDCAAAKDAGERSLCQWTPSD